MLPNHLYLQVPQTRVLITNGKLLRFSVWILIFLNKMLKPTFRMPCIFLIVEDGRGADVELKVGPFFSVRACFRNNPDESEG